MCNTCKIQYDAYYKALIPHLRALDEARTPIWNKYCLGAISYQDYLDTVKPFVAIYGKSYDPLYGAYLQAMRKCKDNGT